MATKYIVSKTIKCKTDCINNRSVGYIYFTTLDINTAHKEVDRQNAAYRCGCRCGIIEVKES